MARLPFHRELEDLFSSDRSIFWKLLAGGLVGGFLSLRMVLKAAARGTIAFSTPEKVGIVVVAACIGMLIVLLLSLRDVVVRRVEDGERVNPLLRAYFGQGNGCLMVFLWSLTVILVTFLVTMVCIIAASGP